MSVTVHGAGRVFLLLFPTVLLAQAVGMAGHKIDREEIWRQYVEWKSSRFPSRTQSRYEFRDKLAADGVPLAEAERINQVIENRLLYRPDGRQYQRVSPDYGRSDRGPRRPRIGEWKTNLLLNTIVAALPPGRALDTTIGQGHDWMTLAARGWRVTGFDVSGVRLAAVRGEAARYNLPVETARASYGSFGYGAGRWDLVVMLYPNVRVGEWVAGRIVQSLVPGGVFVYENYVATGEQPPGGDGSLPPGRLLELFSGLEVVYHTYRDGARPVIRFAARKAR